MNTNQKLLEEHFTVFKRLRKEYPEKNVLYAALENLKTEEEIREFFPQYVEWLTVKGDPVIGAKSNIQYVAMYYGNHQEILDRWAIVLG